MLVALAVVTSSLLSSTAPFLTRDVFDRALFPPGGGPVDLRLLGWLVAGLCTIPVLTALIGSPFFFLLLRRTRRRQGGWA